MTEPTEPTAPAFHERVRGPDPLRPIVILAAALVVLMGAAVVVGASPAATSGPGASAAPGETADPDDSTGTRDRDDWMLGPLGDGDGGFFGRGRFGIHGLGAISITAISGSEVSLETDNGWRRTITVTADTTITRAGQEIELGDLRVGDRVGLREQRNDDGSFQVTHIVVLLPTTAGEVTAKTASSITIRRFDGQSVTIHVDADTSYRVAGREDASLADIEVGMALIAQGAERADGSLDADHVRAGTLRRMEGRERLRLPWPGKAWRGAPWAPDASPEPSPSTESGSVG